MFVQRGSFVTSPGPTLVPALPSRSSGGFVLLPAGKSNRKSFVIFQRFRRSFHLIIMLWKQNEKNDLTEAPSLNQNVVTRKIDPSTKTACLRFLSSLIFNTCYYCNHDSVMLFSAVIPIHGILPADAGSVRQSLLVVQFSPQEASDVNITEHNSQTESKWPDFQLLTPPPWDGINGACWDVNYTKQFVFVGLLLRSESSASSSVLQDNTVMLPKCFEKDGASSDFTSMRRQETMSGSFDVSCQFRNTSMFNLSPISTRFSL